MDWHKGEFTISDERARLDIAFVHEFLSTESYWARGRRVEVVRRAIENSLPFGLYKGERQIGFARAVTDYATFAWLADVFVLEEFRGHGLGVWLVETALAHPALQRLRRWILATRDAHSLYRRFGFRPASADFFMEKLDDDN
jgi:GNAT superfamily N-acetyltransferase